MHVISGGSLVVELDERRGGEITQIRYGGQPILASYDWPTPIGVNRSTSYGNAKLDWLSEYRGGWQLLVPNAGAACEVEGVPLPFHGEWSRTHVTVAVRAVDRVTLTAGTRLPLVVEREIRVVEQPDRVLVTTRVRNTTSQPSHFIWGEHPAFAVGDGDTIDFPDSAIYSADGEHLGQWPSTRDGRQLDRVETSQPTESVHFLVGCTQGWAALRRGTYGVALSWNVNDFPHAWLWHEIASPGFPFYGRASIVAIEPASSWPGQGLAAAIAAGQAIRLEPHEERSTVVALIPFEDDGRAVTDVNLDGHINFSPAL